HPHLKIAHPVKTGYGPTTPMCAVVNSLSDGYRRHWFGSRIQEAVMSEEVHVLALLDGDAGKAEAIIEVRREAALLKTGALQNAIFNSANFSSIATDEKGVIQLFNVGAERMLGYTAADVVDKMTPADISDPQEVIARAKALSDELATPITP